MPSLSPDDLDFLTELAMKHDALLQRLRNALEADDDQRALAVAREMFGIKGRKEDARKKKSAASD